jgi:hypothetical protein
VRHFPRIASLVLIAAAVYMAVVLVRQLRDPEFDGPPIAALCMAVPIVILLMCAGTLWSVGKPRAPGSRDDGVGLR